MKTNKKQNKKIKPQAPTGIIKFKTEGIKEIKITSNKPASKKNGSYRINSEIFFFWIILNMPDKKNGNKIIKKLTIRTLEVKNMLLSSRPALKKIKVEAKVNDIIKEIKFIKK